MERVLIKKKKVLTLAVFFFFAVGIPVLGYFLSSERSFDYRGFVSSLEIEIEFTAEPDLIRRGEESLLSWSVEGAYRCVAASDDFGNWVGRKALSGSEGVSPTHTNLYSLSCNREDYALTKWALVNVVDPSPKRECEKTEDCFRRPPYEICFNEYCLRGDINNDENVAMADFEEFKKDYIVFQTDGWNMGLRRSDLNMDERISMEDYGIFVNAYRLVNRLK